MPVNKLHPLHILKKEFMKILMIALIGPILATAGITVFDWQLYAVLVCVAVASF